jgi:carbon starvation protein
VRDPLGGINSLWPLFGIANQLLASIALCLATTVILKMQLQRRKEGLPGRPAYALVTLIPLLWLMAVTTTASVQKIFHPDVKIGFLAQVKALETARPALEARWQTAQAQQSGPAIAAAERAVKRNQSLRFNARLNAIVAGTFLVLVTAIVFLSVLEWLLLLAQRRLSTLHETAPVWLPDYALTGGKPWRFFTLFALSLALLRELSGEAQLARAEQKSCACGTDGEKRFVTIDLGETPGETPRQRRQRLYDQAANERFSRPNRCC